MDKKYIDLFKEIAQVTAVSAEQVMDYDIQKDDKNGFAAAQIMRNNFADLHERITKANEEYTLNKTDAAKLTVGVLILINQLTDRMKALQKAIAGYQTDILPKLQSIVDDSADDDEAIKMAEEKFKIENTENNE